MKSFDDAVIGAGIAGLSLAWHLRRAGRRVVVLEADPRAEGASVRNFGMLWAVGQADEGLEALALRSQEHWAEAAEDAGFEFRRCGSLHLAYEEAEMQVLKEFSEAQSGRHDRRLLSPLEAADLCPAIRTQGLLGALHSPTEAVVDPREAVHFLAAHLEDQGVEIRWGWPVSGVEPGRVLLSEGGGIEAERIAVCAGPQLRRLLPQTHQRSGIGECRLQMLRLRPKPDQPRLGIHLCAGLTLGHYANFAACPSLPDLRARHAERWPRQIEDHIHVLVSEHADGTITVGDSHAYGLAGPIYREEATDDAILEALDEFLPLDGYEVAQRWWGAYPVHSQIPYWMERIGAGIWGINLFGTGMTLSFGVTELLARKMAAQ
jgi:FAD dependent oxidoreductase TIGR03364